MSSHLCNSENSVWDLVHATSHQPRVYYVGSDGSQLESQTGHLVAGRPLGELLNLSEPHVCICVVETLATERSWRTEVSLPNTPKGHLCPRAGAPPPPNRGFPECAPKSLSFTEASTEAGLLPAGSPPSPRLNLPLYAQRLARSRCSINTG